MCYTVQTCTGGHIIATRPHRQIHFHHSDPKYTGTITWGANDKQGPFFGDA